MKILINALSGNGDALMFSPALGLLRKHLPEAEIDMLVMFRSVREMYQFHPVLKNIHLIEFLKQPKPTSIKQLFALRKNKYDVSINVYPSNRFEYNVVNFILGAKQKLAHHYTHTNVFRAEWLNNMVVNEIPDRHNVLQNFDLIKKIINSDEKDLGNMEIFFNEKHLIASEKWIKEMNPQGKKLIGFHAGSATLKNQIHKRWGMLNYAKLAKILAFKYNAKILLFGNEIELNEDIKRLAASDVILASTSDYMDSMARMRLCDLFVSNDSAFLHSAAAFKIPTVAIFAYTNYKELHPWKNEHIIIRKDLTCSPCFYNSPRPVTCIWKGVDEFKCIKTIGVDEVLEACDRMMEVK
ncbi:glycosyltransferase family 9 protein [soil metagenome]